MARLFNDGAGSTYDAANHKFNDNPFTTMAPFKYANEISFFKAVDNTIPGQMRDCAECHVGGGAMEYIPAKQPELRVSLRALGDGSTPATVNGTTVGASDYTAFNYFIDQYGASGNGSDATFSVVKNDFNATGVLEMDCLMCHLDGYSWEHRTEAVRKGQFDASRAVGAGLGTAASGTTVDYDSNKVEADTNGNLKLKSSVIASIKGTPGTNNCASCHQGREVLEHGVPTLAKQVDWKKRGDQLINSTNAEVHLGLGCMGCHKRKSSDTVIGTSGFGGPMAKNMGQLGLNAAETQAKVLSLCDPAKGDTNFEGLNNPTDNTIKTCRNCHYNEKEVYDGNGKLTGYTTAGLTTAERFSAPNPDAKHAARGLNVTRVQMPAKAGYVAGAANASHIDLLSCEACHTRKKDGVTGNAIIDATGADAVGRLADHENHFLERDMEDNFIFTWHKGQLIPGNFSSSIFWREMDWNLDANLDGRAGGLDSILQTHIAKINKDKFGSTESMTEYYMTHAGEDYVDAHYPAKYSYTNKPYELDAADIEKRAVALRDGLFQSYGIGTPESAGDRALSGNSKLKLSVMMAPFSINHNVSKASQAWGVGGCTDCHSSNAKFWGGTLDPKGKGLKISFENDGTPRGMQFVPFTLVNGSTQQSDFHPNVMDKTGGRSLAYQYASGAVSPGNFRKTLTPIDRAAAMYEATFMTRDSAWKNSLTATNVIAPVDVTEKAAAAPLVNWPNNLNMSTMGWLFKIEVADTAGNPVKTYTRMVGAYFANANDLLNDTGNAGKGLALIKDTPHFTISALDSYNLQIVAKPGYQLRLDPESDAGAFGMGNELWTQKIHSTTTNGIKGTNGSFYAGRSAWVNYLNTLGQPPVANIVHASAAAYANGDNVSTSQTYTVTLGDTVNLIAGNAGTGAQYAWTINDGGATPAPGQATTRVFTKTGTFILGLTAKTELGTAKDYCYIKVVSPLPAGGAATWAPTTGMAGTLEVTGLPTHTKIYVLWGDLTSSTWDNNSGNHSVPHTFKAISTKLVDTNNDGTKDTYRYPISIRVYNNSTLVKTISATVDIAK